MKFKFQISEGTELSEGALKGVSVGIGLSESALKDRSGVYYLESALQYGLEE